MLFEYVVGGELFTYLRNAGRFSTSTGKINFITKQFIIFRSVCPYRRSTIFRSEYKYTGATKQKFSISLSYHRKEASTVATGLFRLPKSVSKSIHSDLSLGPDTHSRS